MQMKFDIEIPEWANWIAQDGDGQWNAFDIKPIAMGGPIYGLWYGEKFKIIALCLEPEDWTQELYQVVWK